MTEDTSDLSNANPRRLAPTDRCDQFRICVLKRYNKAERWSVMANSDGRDPALDPDVKHPTTPKLLEMGFMDSEWPLAAQSTKWAVTFRRKA